MTSLNFFVSGDYSSPVSTRDFIVIASSKNVLTANIEVNSSLCRGLSLSKSTDLELLAVVVDLMSPKSEIACQSDFKFFSDDRTVKKIWLAILPTQYSRHNTSSRSHSVSNIVKKYFTGSDTAIFLLLDTIQHIFPQACAASRVFPMYSHKSSSRHNCQVDIVIHAPAGSEINPLLLKQVSSVTSSIRLCQRLVDAPPNILHTDKYVEECSQIQKQLNCQMTMIRGEDLRSQGFGGIYEVGKASDRPPVLIILSSNTPAQPGTVSNKSICLVGKGIVYDTGGLSIKTGGGMVSMKTDMGGSAAVLGAFQSIVQTNVNKSTPVHALLCIAENSVGPTATRPDDIHTLYSGKTVEINNTDAEGRLVLSDGCAYAARHLNPKYIIDMATLTGSQSIATGKKCAAIYCSDEDLEKTAVDVGRATGDLTFPIPYIPEFFKPEFRSEVADMKNSAINRNNALTSCAGQFIGNHIEEFLSPEVGGKWLHIDMAGPSFESERATGYGVALMYGLVETLSE